jgi:hypothetical protein
MGTGVRTRRAQSAPGRFTRSAPSARRSAPARVTRRRPAKPSGVQKLLGSVLPGARGAQAAPSSKKGKAGGFALVAAAAGMAFKNRDKLARLRRSKDAPPVVQTTGDQTDIPGPVRG